MANENVPEIAQKIPLREKLYSFLKGDAKPAKQIEHTGKGLMHGFEMLDQMYYGYVYNTWTLQQKRQRLLEYREMAYFPEVADAVDLIIDSCIQRDIEDKILWIEILNNDLRTGKNGKIAELLNEEFKDFIENVYGGERELYANFRYWFVDGQIFLETVKQTNSNGYKKVKRLPSETLMPEFDNKGAVRQYVQIVKDMGYVAGGGGPNTYNPWQQDEVITFNPEEITYLDSGLYGEAGLRDPRSRMEFGLKTYRQLRLLEDALVIYRLVRAPERRVFKVDVGNMAKTEVDEYMKELMARYRSKQIYDSTRGEVSRKYNPIAMTEDFWIPTRGPAGGGTVIDSLPGASNLGNITDVEYFLKKIYRALKVPPHLTDETASMNERTAQTNRQEVRFARYCESLQYEWVKHILYVFIHHIRLKNLDKSLEDIQYNDIRIKMTAPSYYKEFRDIEVEAARMELFNSMIGTATFPRTWLLKNILKMTEEQIKSINEEMKNEDMFKTLDELQLDQLGADDSADGFFGKSPAEKAQDDAQKTKRDKKIEKGVTEPEKKTGPPRKPKTKRTEPITKK